MNAVSTIRATLLAAAIATGVAGCGDTQEEMSQEEIQYLSHLDQSRFFQRQGELKASTLEARSAIELQSERIEPYLVIIGNLLTAGDAINAERQLDQLLEQISEDDLNQSQRNEVALIRAEANLMQRDRESALAALDSISSPDRRQKLEAALLRGDIELAAGNPDAAEAAFRQAMDHDETSARPLLGLSRTALARNNPDQAGDFLAQAQEVEPNHEEVWLWKARLAHSQEKWAEAEQAYINALETIGQYDVMTQQKYETMSALIDVLRQQNKSSEAFVYEEILARSAPGTIKSNMTAAQNAFNDGDLATAARYLEEVLKQVPGHEQSALMLGVIRYRQGRPEEAAELLEPLAALEDQEQAQKLLAATRIRLRDPEGAKALLNEMEGKDTDPETLALVGIASLASGDNTSGSQLIEKALELAPDNHQLRLRYANWLIRDGQNDKAIDQASRVMKKAPELEQARVLIIRAHNNAGNETAALESASAWVKEQPQNLQALITRGELAASQGDTADARRYFEQAAKAAPDNAAPQIALANLAGQQGDRATAASHFREAIKRAPDNRAALQGISATMERDQLASFMASVSEQQPEAIGPRLILLETALIDNDTTKADELTAALLEREVEGEPAPAEPLVASVYHGIAQQLAQRGKNQQAADVLERGRVLFPNNENIAVQAAAVEFQQGNDDQARTILREVKSNHPESPTPYRVEAQYLESQEEFRQAAELYQLALSKAQTPDLVMAHARTLEASGQADTAIEVLTSALDDYPGNEAIMLNLALFQQQAGNREQAVARYQQLVEQHPNNTVALNNLAWLYYQDNDDRARDLARRAYERSPNSAAVADTYGWILYEAGEHEQSLAVLEKAHELEPDSEEIALHLAEVYRASGRDADARRILEKFGNNG